MAEPIDQIDHEWAALQATERDRGKQTLLEWALSLEQLRVQLDTIARQQRENETEGK